MLASCPGSHAVQEVAPVVELTLPSSQTSHVVMSADLYCPAGQGSGNLGAILEKQLEYNVIPKFSVLENLYVTS